MRIRKIAIAALLTAVIAQGQDRKSDAALFPMIRQGDERGVEALLRGGTDPNICDNDGATALMHAAAFGSSQTMRLLVQAGANVNATNDKGATALMWAAHDAAKVRLLLEHGANVNAKTREGTNALISAALRGNVEVMRILVAAGANVQDGTVFAPWKMDLANIAYTTNDAAIREFLDAHSTQDLDVAAMTPPPVTSWLLTNVFAWRPQPALTNSTLLKALLDRGANPNEMISHLTLAVPALARAVRLDDMETVRLLIERGADVNGAGSQGLTPLMFAAAGNPNPETVQLLLDKGAALDARDQKGRTALDWAVLQDRPLRRADTLVRVYRREADKQKLMVKRAQLTEARLLFIVSALKKLFQDDDFIAVLRSEGLDSLPAYLAERIQIEVKV